MHANASLHHPRRGMRGYIALWAALASLALAYLAALSLKPELVAPLARAPAQSDGYKVAVRALAETGQVRQGVEELRQELAQVRDAIGKLEVREKETLARLEKVEARDKERERVAEAPEPPAATPPATPAKLTEGKLREGSIIEGRIVDRPEAPQAPAAPQLQLQPPPQAKAPQPPQLPQQVAAARPAPPTLPPVLPIQVSPTPPITLDPAASFGTTVVKATPEPLGLVLATGPSVDALRLSWMLLNERHKATLKKLEPRAVAGPEGGSGPSYQLIVGPVRSIDEANRLCAQLKARKVSCAPAQFAGEAL